MERTVDYAIPQMQLRLPDGRTALASYSPKNGLRLIADPKPTSSGSGENSGEAARGKADKPVDKDTPQTIQTIKLIITRLLKQNKVGKVYAPRQRKGRLDVSSKSLTRAMTGGENIYKRQVKPTRGYNFLFLVDTSGSMSGKRIELTNNVLHSLIRGLDDDEIHTAVLDFSNKLIWQKGWKQSPEELRTLSAGGGNGDYQALQYALRYGFSGAPEDCKNILIMLSDGEPCSDRLATVTMIDGTVKPNPLAGGIAPSDSDRIRVMAQTEAQKRHIALYGIGILSRANQIPRRSVVKSLSDLQPTIEKVIRDLL